MKSIIAKLFLPQIKKPLPKLNLDSGPTTLILQRYLFISEPYAYEIINVTLIYEK
jgi:hypothetical protein